MFWFSIITFIIVICFGLIGFVVGFRSLQFGQNASKQGHTIRLVLISAIDILTGGFLLAAVATEVVDPVIALILAIFILLSTYLGIKRAFGDSPVGPNC